jgi:O-antigen/teichoic acid export membrane protein
VQDDPVRLKTGYRRVVEMTTFLVFPALLFIASLARQLFSVALPTQWHPAAVYFQLLCLAALLYPLHSINLNILKVKGRSDLFLLLETVKKGLAVLIVISSYRYGILGILYGQILASVLAYFLNASFSARLINYPVMEQIRDFAPGLGLATLIAVGIHAAQSWLRGPALLQLIGLGGVALPAYVFGSHLLKLSAYQSAKQLFTERLKRA